jgi:hypothetical protein
MRHCFLLAATTIVLAAAAVQPAHATLDFYNVFKKEYVEKHSDKKFAEEVGKASNRCFVCHQGKVRKHHNEFGKHLVPLLDKKEDAKNIEKITAEIKKVLVMNVDPKDKKSETYLDRWKAGKWPGGKLEDLKKEPKDGEGDEKKDEKK